MPTSTPTGAERAATERVRRTGRTVLVITAVSALGGLLFGYDTGIISAALLFITRDIPVDIFGKELVTSAIVAGALVGCLASGPVSDRIGRRPTILAAAILFIAGSVASALSGSANGLIAARVLLGIAVGATSQIIPVYIAELAPAARRGGLVLLFQLAIVAGILVSTIIGWLLGGTGGNWRTMFLLGSIPALVLFVGMLFLPESPRFLVLRGRPERALRILQATRPTDAAASEELRAVEAQPREDGSWSLLFSHRVRPALVAGAGLGMFCQVTGTNATIYYAPTVLASAGFGAGAALQAQMLIGLTIVLATLFGLWAVDRWGRRRLMLRFLLPAALGLVLLGGSFLHGNPTGAGRFTAVIGLVAYEIFNVGSISASIWLVGAEVFPLAIRGKGMSVVALSHWAFDLLVSLLTLSMVSALGAAYAFFAFATVNILAWLFVLRCVPETNGRSLEEIEQRLHDGSFSAMR